MSKHTLWVEKYRPDILEGYLGNEEFINGLQEWINKNDFPNLLLHGPAGTGKTTAAKLVVKNINCDFLYLNCSDENGIDTIRDKVKQFASGATFKPLKVVILDEADFLTINAQAALRNVIESFSLTTRFIFTCNFVERIIDPLQSRCQVFKVVPPTKKEVALHLASVCDKESISYEPTAIGKVVNKFYPDLRKMLNTIQSSTINGKLELDDSLLVSTSYMLAILEELKTKKPNFIKIRQTIADANVDDFEELFRFLYDESSQYLPNKEGTVAMLVNEHQYKANFRIDKEINTMSLIQNLIENK